MILRPNGGRRGYAVIALVFAVFMLGQLLRGASPMIIPVARVPLACSMSLLLRSWVTGKVVRAARI